MKRNYGIPYKGSKNKIAEDIINFLPKRKILVDLFGGGGAISDCAMQSGKYEKIIYNELDTIIADTFKKTLKGEYTNETRWISHDDFFKLRHVDGYVAICFSFSNNCRSYLYSPKTEPYKRAYHYAIVFNDFQPLAELFDDDIVMKLKSSLDGILDVKERRIIFTHCIKNFVQGRMEMQHLERKERLQSIGITSNLLQNAEACERLKMLCNNFPIEIHSIDYANVELPKPEDCVIYCDIPYENTERYKNKFDYNRFYQWVLDKSKEGYDIYISSYELSEDKFTEVWRKEKYGKLRGDRGIHTIEKIFIPNK